MADNADEAQINIERELEIALSEVTTHTSLAPCGKCYCCGAPTDGDQLFCDLECVEEWEWIKEREKANAP